ncbi:hypothetical protein DFJ73DRAFT_784207 [Zopfochytrium polystomum]|nr:hypothetical protein DFJ73DRAFT_784207 [Zopfochytrium polystomum]
MRILLLDHFSKILSSALLTPAPSATQPPDKGAAAAALGDCHHHATRPMPFSPSPEPPLILHRWTHQPRGRGGSYSRSNGASSCSSASGSSKTADAAYMSELACFNATAFTFPITLPSAPFLSTAPSSPPRKQRWRNADSEPGLVVGSSSLSNAVTAATTAEAAVMAHGGRGGRAGAVLSWRRVYARQAAVWWRLFHAATAAAGGGSGRAVVDAHTDAVSCGEVVGGGTGSAVVVSGSWDGTVKV